ADEALVDAGLAVALPVDGAPARLILPDAVHAYVVAHLGTPDQSGAGLTRWGKQRILRAICDWYWAHAKAARDLVGGEPDPVSYECSQRLVVAEDPVRAATWLKDHRDHLTALASHALRYGLYETCVRAGRGP
ncbi:hypothetical protein ACFQ1S_36180, partial [Kibdelosporangium lantanae]